MAERAKSSGRHDEAARGYREAALATGRRRERDEGLYLEAATLAQAGRSKEAMAAFDALIAASPRGERAARAAYDRAFLEIEHGEAAKGWALLERAVLDHPDVASSRRALRKLVEHHEAQRKGGGRAFLEARAADLDRAELAEDAAYLRARALRAEGLAREARDAFVACATRFVYPSGTLTDDAWYAAADLDLELGEPLVALEHLRRLLAPREPSALGQGSYERPLYSPAQLRIAEIHRDHLHDVAAARREFRRLYAEFTTSSLRDDALWADALLARKAGDERGACEAANSLAREFPKSRYAACSPLVCPATQAPEGAMPCRPYVRAQIDDHR